MFDCNHIYCAFYNVYWCAKEPAKEPCVELDKWSSPTEVILIKINLMPNSQLCLGPEAKLGEGE